MLIYSFCWNEHVRFCFEYGVPSPLKDSIKSQASSVKITMVSHQQLIGDVKSMLTTMAKVGLVILHSYSYGKQIQHTFPLRHSSPLPLPPVTVSCASWSRLLQVTFCLCAVVSTSVKIKLQLYIVICHCLAFCLQHRQIIIDSLPLINCDFLFNLVQ